MTIRKCIAVCIAIVIFSIFSGCDRKSEKEATSASVESTAQEQKEASSSRSGTTTTFENYEEKGDLDAIKKRGVIRIIVLTSIEQDKLPRSEIITQQHVDLAKDFAKHLGIKIQWMVADSPEHAIELIESGRADLLADVITVTKSRQAKVTFSIPLQQTRQQLVAGKDGPDISAADKLQNVTLVVPTQSTHVQAAKQIVKDHPDKNLQIEEVPWSIELDGLIDKIVADPKMAAILDSNVIEGLLEYRSDVKAGATVSDLENIAWVTRKGSDALTNSLNQFLSENLVKKSERRISDWPAIKDSKVLRLLTYNDPTSYFLWKGYLMGFDYDLAKDFAEENDLQLQVIVVPSNIDLSKWLKEGRGDIASAATTITPELKEEGVAFSTPYVEVQDQILSSKGKPAVKSEDDLKGRKVTVRWHSSAQRTAEALKKKGVDFELEVAPPEVSSEQIINMVDNGDADATIVDAYAAEIAVSLRPELLLGMIVGEPMPQGVMVMPQNKDLVKKLDEFISKFRDSEEYKKLTKVYLKPKPKREKVKGAEVKPGGPLSPYDNLVQQAADKHEIDWRLITAQMWQESNFDPKAESPVGAQGLLQVMPLTAEEMGYKPPLYDPDRGIAAGVKYLDWVSNRFPDDLPLKERIWFSLAAYNAGIGHLLDARRLAKQLGLDPDVWFDNVEVAMLKLSEPRYFEKARYGFVRGAEPKVYVSNISKLYEAYSEAMPESAGGRTRGSTSSIAIVRPPLKMPLAIQSAIELHK